MPSQCIGPRREFRSRRRAARLASRRRRLCVEEKVRQRGMTPRIARRSIEKNDRLGKHRWVVERTHAWLAGFGMLRIRFERSLDTHLALLNLACAVICGRFVDQFC
ncbi:hypothetical protein AB851_17555 [Ralstonia pseudosolanacearum]|nr:hypothetical protein AB851_17555 [Ralstonia pseudosolanacearum]